MTGWTDGFDCALVSLNLQHPTTGATCVLDAWIDTACRADLLLPLALVQALGLPWVGDISTTLVDGSQAILQRHSCLVPWFGQLRQIEAAAVAGPVVLIGIGLLKGRKLTIDYPARFVQID